MKQVLVSKHEQKRKSHILSIVANKPSESDIIYIYPKNRQHEPIDGVYSVTFEDVTKDKQWLEMNAILNENTILILENPSRYPKITSTKYDFLYRLSMKVQKGNVFIVDIVPFTLDIVYLYTTYVYISRSILGHPHWYAFRENYGEMQDDGTVLDAHDHTLLAKKIMAVTAIDYDGFLCKNRTVVNVTSKDEEHDVYAQKKEELFEKEKNITRIITRLADTAHALKSRVERVVELASSLEGKTVIYTNLATYAAKIKKEIGRNKNIICTSYQKGHVGDVDNIIYAESPIVKSYLLLDAESRANESTKVFHILGDTGVDKHLFDQLDSEIKQIDSLTKEMYQCQ